MSILNRYMHFAFTFALHFSRITRCIHSITITPFSFQQFCFCRFPLSPWPAVVGVCYSKAGASIIKMQFNFSRALILPASLLFSVVLIKLLTSAYPLDEIDTRLFTVIITPLPPTHNACFSQGFPHETF